MGCCVDSSVAPEVFNIIDVSISCSNDVNCQEDEEDMDGPLEDRSCTDVIFFVLFGAFMVGMVSQNKYVHIFTNS